MDSHATFVSDIFLCICTGSGFTMNLEWSQQMMRGSWLDLKSQLTEPLVTKSNSSEELIATLASTGMGNLKAVQILSVTMKLSHSPMQFSEVEETICSTYGRGFVVSAFVKVWGWWHELYKILVWIFAIHAPQVGCKSCRWLTWLKAANTTKSKYMANGICSFRVFLVRFHVSDGKLESLREPGMLLP